MGRQRLGPEWFEALLRYAPYCCSRELERSPQRGFGGALFAIRLQRGLFELLEHCPASRVVILHACESYLLTALPPLNHITTAGRAAPLRGLSTVCRIAIAEPDVGLNPELIFAVGELAHELRLAAEREARFEHAAALAAQLSAELRTQGSFALYGPRQRPAGRRRVRGPRATARLVQALRDESTALASVLAVAEDLGVRITHMDLADLRLGERTRRIFHDAGLTLVEDVASLPPERAADIPRLAPANLAELRAAIHRARGSPRTPGSRPATSG
jgi:hypothetical protein